MARTYVYRLVHTQVAAAAGVAEITVPGAGRIVGFHSFELVGGGAASGYYRSELAVNNNAVTNAGVNYPPRNLTLGSWGIISPNGANATMDTGFIPCDVPVNSGDRLSINQTSTGTNAATRQANCDVYFVDGK